MMFSDGIVYLRSRFARPVGQRGFLFAFIPLLFVLFNIAYLLCTLKN